MQTANAPLFLPARPAFVPGQESACTAVGLAAWARRPLSSSYLAELEI